MKKKSSPKENEEQVLPWVPVKLYTEYFQEEVRVNEVGEEFTVLNLIDTTEDFGSIDIRDIRHFFNYRSETREVVEGVYYVYMADEKVFALKVDVGDLYRWRQIGDIMRKAENS